MSGKIIPRCPKCNKRAINWLEGNASFTCQNNHCKTEFELVDGRVLIVHHAKPLKTSGLIYGKSSCTIDN